MRIFAIVAALALLAGCTEDNTGDAGTDGGDIIVDQQPFNLTTGAGNTGISVGAPDTPVRPGPGFSSGATSVPFTVQKNATLIFVEISWDDDVNDIDLALRSPNAGETGGVQNYDYSTHGGGIGSPDSPHSITLTGEDVIVGDWQASGFVTGATNGIAFQIAATVFYGETEVPEGYTGLE